MRKALKKVILLTLSTLIFATLLANTSSASTSNKDYVFDYLTNEMGLNSAAACGIMANIESESKFVSTSVIVDTNGLLSGGLCQWNGSRFTKLISYCNSIGLDYLSVEGQLRYLQYELENGYSSIYSYLMSVPDTQAGAYDAGYYWCYYFEIPANRSTKAVTRGNSAQYSYWSTYGARDVSTPTLELNDDIFDLDTNVKFTFSAVESYVDIYTLYVAKADEAGDFNWSDAQAYDLSTDELSKKIKTFEIGDYACYIEAKYSSTGLTSDEKDILYFSVECQTHDFISEVIEEATLYETGLKQYCCATCEENYTAVISKLELNDLQIVIDEEKVQVSSTQVLEVTESYTANTISLTGESADLNQVDALCPTSRQESSSKKVRAEKSAKTKIASL